MVKNLTIAVLAVVAASGFWLLWTKTNPRSWYRRDYVCVVLTDDVVLKAGLTHEVVGTLKKGTVLFVPDKEDYRVTDPGDTSLHQVYVSLTADMEGKFRRVPQEVSATDQSMKTYNYLVVYPREREPRQ